VQTVALELGYENASGFITMFRKAVGKPPARYLSDRTTGTESAAVPGIRLPDQVSSKKRSESRCRAGYGRDFAAHSA
jgi:AraC-like DNA-binding protein